MTTRFRYVKWWLFGLLLVGPLYSQEVGPAAGLSAVEATLHLSSDDLFNGLEAMRVIHKPDGLGVDYRSQSDPPTVAQVTTDVIDLGGESVLSDTIEVTALKVDTQSNASNLAELVVYFKSGTSFFQDDGTWSDWSTEIQLPICRYIQLQFRLPTPRKAFRLNGVTINYSYRKKATFQSKLELVRQDIQQITRSTVPFAYQRPDHPDLTWLRETFNIDRIVVSQASEFEKVSAICTWVSSRKNDRDSGWNTLPYYPWNVRRIFDPKDDGTIYGHCASYCSVFLACCQSLGWQGRHFAVEGYRENCHEVAEIYINELGRWIYFDPSLATHYRSLVTGEPLDTVQMHDIYLDSHFDQPGDTVPKREFDYDELSRRRATIDWRAFPGQPVAGDWVYGEMKTWDWTKAQGILTTAWLQMTPRANFYDQPLPVFREFGDGPTGECGFPMWVDSRTPPRSLKTHSFFSRRRDLYWTINQCSLRLVRSDDGVVGVELGSNQPFFKRYRIVANGETHHQSDARFQWTLKSGVNFLVVDCEDMFGRLGAPSQVAVRYFDP